MSESWKQRTIRQCLSDSFAGEWGADPKPGNAVVLRATDIDDDGHIIGEGVNRRLPVGKLTSRRLLDGDILLEGSGGGPDKPVGRVAYFDVSTFQSAAVCSNFFKTLRPNRAEVEPRFLLRKLAWFYKQPALLTLQQQTTGIINLKFEEYLSSQIQIPGDIKEQQKLAEVLDTLDTAIHETESIIAKLKAVKQGLLHDLLTRGIATNGELRPPQAEAPHLYKQSPLGWIPKEWDPTPIRRLAPLQRGYDIVESRLLPGPYPVISSSGIVGYHSASTSRGPNVVVGRKGSIGTVHFVENDFWAHDTSLFVTNFYGNNVRFISYLFAFLRLERYGTKSGSPSLNRNDVHDVFVGRPPRSEQGTIADILSSHEDSIERTQKNSDKLHEMKAGLMDDLLTGRVRVTPLLQTEALS